MIRLPLRRRGAAIAGLPLLLLLLTGCGGIPISGPVVAGPAVNEVDPEYVVTPNGPVAGADPAALLSGFMQAVRAPQSDFAIARQFLTPEFAAEWDPSAGVLIRSLGATTAVAGTPEAPVLTYTFATAASVDSAGRYHEVAVAGARTLEFAFAEVNGQWRISAAPDGIVLSGASFVRAFEESPLYYFDPTRRYLVPDVRWFPARPSTPTLVVAQLLAGPDEWLRRAVTSAFPSGTTLGPRSVVIEDSRAQVDLSAQASSASPIEVDRMRAQLIASLDVADATITADGVPLIGSQTAAPVTVDPQPAGAVLVGNGTEFGFGTVTGVTPITGISTMVVADAATAVVLSRTQSEAAYRAGDGTVRRVSADVMQLIDTRPGLVAPGLDEFGWVWSGGAGAPLDAFAADGTAAGLVIDAIPADAQVAAIAVSRDSARIAVALTGPQPRLLVFGIARADGTPTGVDGPLELPASGPIASLSWVDDRSLVVVTEGEGIRTAAVVGVGVPGELLGALPTDATAVGGRGGVPGVRALAAGSVLAPGGSGGWTEAGFPAAFLGIQQ